MIAPGGRGGSQGGRRTIGVVLDEMQVSEVVEGSVADKAGIKPGDVIVKLGDKVVEGRDEFSEALQTAGREARVVVKRDGKEVELTLSFPARP